MRRDLGATATTVAEPLSAAFAAGTASSSSVAGSAATVVSTGRRVRIASATACLTASIGTSKFAVLSEAMGGPSADSAESAVG